MLLLSGCFTFRSAGTDKTVWDELPEDPRPELWIEGEPVVPVAFEGVYTTVGESEPVFDEPATVLYQRTLHRARVFSVVLGRDRTGVEGLVPARMECIYDEDANDAANFAKAASLPGLLGYRFSLTATFAIELEKPGAEPVRYEARSAVTRIYHHSDGRDRARRIVYDEVQRANIEALVHQLRADPALFDATDPL